jgi:hypothetical protein
VISFLAFSDFEFNAQRGILTLFYLVWVVKENRES